MKNKTIISTILATAIGVAGVMPVAAAPMRVAPAQATVSDNLVVDVASRGRGFQRRGDHAYMNGHRGYHNRRQGYREYNGFWFPPAAFALGLIIGQTAQPQYRAAPRHQLSQAHYRWCDARYRSYRAYDNSFQPYHGGRKACVSPYY